jgi:exopolyphosphatase/guanosine-5'-triphosphate,3'-diphosphate pyrophosphatase
VRVLESVREPVRLGQDVFSKGLITEPSIQRAIQTFHFFKKLFDQYHITRYRAVATSAFREASNRQMVIDRIYQEAGIQLEVISGLEEARLIALGVNRRVPIRKKKIILVDVGGGSVEVTFLDSQKIVFSESYTLGAVRLLELFEGPSSNPKKFNQLVNEYIATLKRQIQQKLKKKHFDYFFATGGNIETLAQLQTEFFDRRRPALRPGVIPIGTKDLKRMLQAIGKLSFQERIQKLKLRPDRADVIVPAGTVFFQLADLLHAKVIQVPFVGLKDGVLWELINKHSHKISRSGWEKQVITSACTIGKKYFYDEKHAFHVAKLAMRIFDQTKKVHQCNEESRVILNVAALLHDVGYFIGVPKHHKHTYYLVSSSEIVGLNPTQIKVIANIGRYHRRAHPTENHPEYRELNSDDQKTVSRLAAILRLADALDREHNQTVRSVTVRVEKQKILLKISGRGDFLLERWSVEKKSDLYKDVFGYSVKVL